LRSVRTGLHLRRRRTSRKHGRRRQKKHDMFHGLSLNSLSPARHETVAGTFLIPQLHFDRLCLQSVERRHERQWQGLSRSAPRYDAFDCQMPCRVITGEELKRSPKPNQFGLREMFDTNELVPCLAPCADELIELGLDC